MSECEHEWVPALNATVLVCLKCTAVNEHIIDEDGLCLSCWKVHD